MKRLAISALIGLLALASSAVDVRFSPMDSAHNPALNRAFNLYPIDAPFPSGTNQVTRDRVKTNTGPAGVFIVSNLFAGEYRSELAGSYTATTNWYNFPDTNGLVDASPYWSAPTNAQGVAVLDARYWQSAVLGPGTNTTFRTNAQGQVFIDTQDTSGSGLPVNSAATNGLVSTNQSLDFFQAPPQSMFYAAAPTPPIIWISQYGLNTESESSIRTNICIMSTNNLINSGMRWFIIDDCWSRRNATTHNLDFDTTQFPSGGRSLIDFAHQHGVKVILYYALGTTTSAGYDGSSGFYAQDAWYAATNYMVDGIKFEDHGGVSADQAAYEEQLFTSTLYQAAQRPLYITAGQIGVNSPFGSASCFAPWMLRWRSTTYSGPLGVGDPTDSQWATLFAHLDGTYASRYAISPGHFLWGLGTAYLAQPLDLLKGYAEGGCIFPSDLEWGPLWRDDSGRLQFVTNSEVLSIHQDPLVQAGEMLWWNVADGVTNAVYARNLVSPLGTNKAVWLTVRSTNIATTLTVPLTNMATSAGLNWASFKNPWTHAYEFMATNQLQITMTGPTSQLYVVSFGNMTNVPNLSFSLPMEAGSSILGGITWDANTPALYYPRMNGTFKFLTWQVPQDKITSTTMDIIQGFKSQTYYETLHATGYAGWVTSSGSEGSSGDNTLAVTMSSGGNLGWTTNTITVPAGVSTLWIRAGSGDTAPTNTADVDMFQVMVRFR
jgi:hypothetical protein